MISDLDIWRAANLLIQRHGEDAEIEAAKRADQMLERGDLDGQVVWKRIRRAIYLGLQIRIKDADAISVALPLTRPGSPMHLPAGVDTRMARLAILLLIAACPAPTHAAETPPRPTHAGSSTTNNENAPTGPATSASSIGSARSVCAMAGGPEPAASTVPLRSEAIRGAVAVAINERSAAGLPAACAGSGQSASAAAQDGCFRDGNTGSAHGWRKRYGGRTRPTARG